MSTRVVIVEKTRLQDMLAALEMAHRALTSRAPQDIQAALASIEKSCRQAQASNLEIPAAAEVIESGPIGPNAETLKAAFLHDKTLPAGTKLFDMERVQDILQSELNLYRYSWIRTEMALASSKEETLDAAHQACARWIANDSHRELKEPYWNGYQQGVVDCLGEINALRAQGDVSMPSRQEPCDICGEGTSTLQVELNEVERDGQKGLIKTYYRTCDHCGSDYAGSAEAKLNKAGMLSFLERAHRSK